MRLVLRPRIQIASHEHNRNIVLENGIPRSLLTELCRQRRVRVEESQLDAIVGQQVVRGNTRQRNIDIAFKETLSVYFGPTVEKDRELGQVLDQITTPVELI